MHIYIHKTSLYLEHLQWYHRIIYHCGCGCHINSTSQNIYHISLQFTTFTPLKVRSYKLIYTFFPSAFIFVAHTPHCHHSYCPHMITLTMLLILLKERGLVCVCIYSHKFYVDYVIIFSFSSDKYSNREYHIKIYNIWRTFHPWKISTIVISTRAGNF